MFFLIIGIFPPEEGILVEPTKERFPPRFCPPSLEKLFLLLTTGAAAIFTILSLLRRLS